MNKKEIFSEYAKLAKHMGMPVEDVLRLSVKMLEMANAAQSSPDHAKQHAEIEAKREGLRKKMLSGARRTNGALTFPI